MLAISAVFNSCLFDTHILAFRGDTEVVVL